MSNFTLNSVLDSIRSDVQDVLRNVSDSDLRYMTAEDVCDLLDENSYYAPEVIYYADAWEIVAGSSFNDYEAEYLDFSGCENSLQCILHEAIGILESVYYNERENIAQEVLEGLQAKLDGLQEDLPDESEVIWNKSESRLNGLYWAETDNGDTLSFNSQDELYNFLNDQ